jgi:hypothetical protein
MLHTRPRNSILVIPTDQFFGPRAVRKFTKRVGLLADDYVRLVASLSVVSNVCLVASLSRARVANTLVFPSALSTVSSFKTFGYSAVALLSLAVISFHHVGP